MLTNIRTVKAMNPLAEQVRDHPGLSVGAVRHREVLNVLEASWVLELPDDYRLQLFRPIHVGADKDS